LNIHLILAWLAFGTPLALLAALIATCAFFFIRNWWREVDKADLVYGSLAIIILIAIGMAMNWGDSYLSRHYHWYLTEERAESQ